METVIVICLLIIIVLLVQDKIVIKKRSKEKPMQEKVNPNLPDIMGQPKPVRRLYVPNTANESQIEELYKSFYQKLGYTKDDVKDMVFCNYLHKNDINKRNHTKLTQDILMQFELNN